ncbi:glutathione S-transferase family protein [Jannaschia pohangensis]|uniref:Glutathione S-transferase n=1 Tax=Jannaschia pohangensis TaxID=390807 RepID=A0A1I3MJE9_9RHOB|nr:glutathione S-transferase family protein [Jannaschia pohangensis]SFI97041.1 glutathione S-transferase [Jannaschia pohangensis]
MQFYFHTTPNPFKVALMIEELGLSPEIIPVDTRKGEQHAPDFLKVNPNAKLPALVDGSQAIFDSGAIILYLAQKHGKFLPTGDAAMGEVLSWFFFIASGIGPYSGQAVHFTRVHKDSAYATNRYSREIARHYKVLDDRLGASDWIGGADYGICDIAAWGWVRAAGFVMEGQGGLANYPNVQAWFDRVNARPAATRADEYAKKFEFKAEMDEAAMRAMFPQNF